MKDRLTICNDLMNIAANIVSKAVEYNRCVLNQFGDNDKPEDSQQIKKEIKSLYTVYNGILDKLGGWGILNDPKVINSIMDLAKEILDNKLEYFNEISKLMLDTESEKINELNNDMEAIKTAIAVIEKHENKWDRW